MRDARIEIRVDVVLLLVAHAVRPDSALMLVTSSRDDDELSLACIASPPLVSPPLAPLRAMLVSSPISYLEASNEYLE